MNLFLWRRAGSSRQRTWPPRCPRRSRSLHIYHTPVSVLHGNLVCTVTGVGYLFMYGVSVLYSAGTERGMLVTICAKMNESAIGSECNEFTRCRCRSSQSSGVQVPLYGYTDAQDRTTGILTNCDENTLKIGRNLLSTLLLDALNYNSSSRSFRCHHG